MIAYLKGKLIYKQAPTIIIEAYGVGYELLVPMSTYYNVPDLNQELYIYCYQYIREDANLLYGFNNLKDRSLFIELLKINGVGPRLALTILSNYQVTEFINIIENCDASALVRLPGVGKKTADRLLLELRGRLKNIFADNYPSNKQDVNNTTNDHADTTVADAIAALEILGYKAQDSRKMINKLVSSNSYSQEKLTSEYLIKAALKEFR